MWNLDGLPIDYFEFDQFTDSLSHRGPDGRGVYADKNVQLALGHRRLSILDLTDTGQQPMSYASKRYWITYNGEIYNFVELRRDLEALGHRFKSESDTEVILASYVQWGEECQFRFNGMWAFAIWDSQERTLFLSRDRFGVKPVFFMFDGRHFLFASELKAFLALKSPMRPDFDSGMVALLTNRENIEKSLLKNVKNLNGGHRLILKGGGVPNIQKWWRTYDHFVDVPTRFSEKVEKYRELFYDSCKIRMRSDVSIGTALSGGLDSSSVLCAMADIRSTADHESRLAGDWQRAFILDYTGTSHSERHYAEQVVRYTETTPVIKAIAHDTVSEDDLISAIYSLEAIQNREAHIGPWLLYREMRKNGVSVSIDGHGGDETLAGYHHYPEIALQQAIWPWHFETWRDMQDIISGLYSEELEEGHDRRSLTRLSVVKALLRKSIRPSQLVNYLKKNPALFEFLRSCYKQVQNTSMLATDSNHEWLLTRKADPVLLQDADWKKCGDDRVNRSLYTDFHDGYLPTILRNFDRDSMAHGVEIRAPFLDWRLVTYVMSLPSSAKLGGGFTKRILREAMKSHLPETIRMRKSKMGFSSPMIEWYRTSLREFVLDSINSGDFLESSIWDGAVIRNFVENCYRTDRYLDATKSWAYIQAMILMRSFRDKAIEYERRYASRVNSVAR